MVRSGGSWGEVVARGKKCWLRREMIASGEKWWGPWEKQWLRDKWWLRE